MATRVSRLNFAVQNDAKIDASLSPLSSRRESVRDLVDFSLKARVGFGSAHEGYRLRKRSFTSRTKSTNRGSVIICGCQHKSRSIKSYVSTICEPGNGLP